MQQLTWIWSRSFSSIFFCRSSSKTFLVSRLCCEGESPLLWKSIWSWLLIMISWCPQNIVLNCQNFTNVMVPSINQYFCCKSHYLTSTENTHILLSLRSHEATPLTPPMITFHFLPLASLAASSSWRSSTLLVSCWFLKLRLSISCSCFLRLWSLCFSCSCCNDMLGITMTFMKSYKTDGGKILNGEEDIIIDTDVEL